MEKMRILWIALALALAAANGTCAAGKLVAPAPIHLPYGAAILTEVNFSNDDVLGIIRQILPAAGELVSMFAAVGGQVAGNKSPIPPEALAKLDFKPLAEVMEGITNLRVIAAKFRKGLPAADAAVLFDSGAQKAGMVNRIALDFALTPGVFAAYAQADGGAYLAYAYDPKAGMVYAGRLTGKVDIAKLVKWATDMAKLFTPTVKPEEPVQPTQEKAEPSPG